MATPSKTAGEGDSSEGLQAGPQNEKRPVFFSENRAFKSCLPHKVIGRNFSEFFKTLLDNHLHHFGRNSEKGSCGRGTCRVSSKAL